MAEPARWTLVGNVGSPAQALVDPRGLAAPRLTGRDAAWLVDWWIGAEDRWHVPANETGVRQRLLANAPVVETAMRVPGGDVVHRAYAVSGARDLLVIEVENQTPTPVALALAVRPDGLDGPGRIRHLRLGGTTVTVDNRVALFLPRPPARVAAGSGAEGDAARRVFEGTDDPGADVDVACPDGRAHAVFVYPLAHGATLRAAVVLDPDVDAKPPHLDALPSSAEVARGWAAHTRRGMRLELPSGTVADAVEASRRFLLLLPNSGGDRATQALLARALRAHGFQREADDIHGRRNRWFSRLLRRAEPVPPAGPADAWAAVMAMVQTASPTWSWPPGHDAGATAQILLLVRRLLVDDTGRDLVVLPTLPDAWVGQPIEVHDAPTDRGGLSFAVRWHGEHPALLWELDAPPGSPVRITAPGLDPQWSTTDPRGEALLATARA